MKVNILIINDGLYNDFKRTFIPENTNIFYASGFLEVFDIVTRKKISLVFISDFRGRAVTSECAKMLVLANPEVDVIVMSYHKIIKKYLRNYYRQRYVADIINIYDTKNLIKKVEEKRRLKTYIPEFTSKWKTSTKRILTYISLRCNYYKNLKKRIKLLANETYKKLKEKIFNDTGHDIKEWIRKIRLRKVINKTDKNLPLVYLCKEAGYNSRQGFLKAVKKEYGKRIVDLIKNGNNFFD